VAEMSDIDDEDSNIEEVEDTTVNEEVEDTTVNEDACTKEPGLMTWVEFMHCCSRDTVPALLRCTLGWVFALDSKAMSIARPGESVPYQYLIISRLLICWCGYFIATDRTNGKPKSMADTKSNAYDAWSKLPPDEQKTFGDFNKYHEMTFVDSDKKFAANYATWEGMKEEEKTEFVTFDVFNQYQQKVDRKTSFHKFRDGVTDFFTSVKIKEAIRQGDAKKAETASSQLATPWYTVITKWGIEWIKQFFEGPAGQWIENILQTLFELLKTINEVIMEGPKALCNIAVEKLTGKQMFPVPKENGQPRTNYWFSMAMQFFFNLYDIISNVSFRFSDDTVKLLKDKGVLNTLMNNLDKTLQAAWKMEVLKNIKNIATAVKDGVQIIPKYFAKTTFLILVRNFDRFARDRLAALFELLQYRFKIKITRDPISKKKYDKQWFPEQIQSPRPVMNEIWYAFLYNGGYRNLFRREVFPKGERIYVYIRSDDNKTFDVYADNKLRSKLISYSESIESGWLWFSCLMQLFNADLSFDATQIPGYSLMSKGLGAILNKFNFTQKIKEKYSFTPNTKMLQTVKELIFPTPLIIRMAREAKSGKYKFNLYWPRGFAKKDEE